jgi:hypothetical protein
MEGDYSLAGLVLVEYYGIKEFLQKQIFSCVEQEFKGMLEKMIEKTDTYLNEALSCDSILLATMLNPSYWLAIFELYFPSCHCYAK